MADEWYATEAFTNKLLTSSCDMLAVLFLVLCNELCFLNIVVIKENYFVLNVSCSLSWVSD